MKKTKKKNTRHFSAPSQAGPTLGWCQAVAATSGRCRNKLEFKNFTNELREAGQALLGQS